MYVGTVGMSDKVPDQRGSQECHLHSNQGAQWRQSFEDTLNVLKYRCASEGLHCMWRIMNIAYTSIGKRVMKTDAKGWKVGGAKDDLRQFNHESLVGLMSETF